MLEQPGHEHEPRATYNDQRHLGIAEGIRDNPPESTDEENDASVQDDGRGEESEPHHLTIDDGDDRDDPPESMDEEGGDGVQDDPRGEDDEE